MSKIKLLDCTLRDGGYINEWNFGKYTIKDIIAKLVAAGVDYVEVGFLRNCIYDPEKSLFNNCGELSQILPEERGKTKFTAMALHNKYDIDKLEPYDGKTIDAIRVTFHDYDIDEGLEYIKKVIDKGYKVFINPINIMGYSDAMILELLQKVNKIHPYAFSIVDTFGSMMKEDLQRIYSLIEHNLDRDIVIGLHLHENLALSYSLAQEFIGMKNSERRCVIDASMLGMGRAPGNLCMELIMDYMNKQQEGGYDVNPVLDGIDDHIAKLKEIEPWGYHTAYALSAKYNLHRNYAEFLLDKGRLRAKQINQILGSIRPEKKTAYDEKYIEQLYQTYQSNEVNDEIVLQTLRQEFQDKKVLVLAPGASISKNKDKIKAFVLENQPIVIAAHFVPEDIDTTYVFCCNAVRYEMLRDQVEPYKMVITSNLLDVCGGEGKIVNYAELGIDENGVCDNSVIMLLRLLKKVGATQIHIAGFDGYQQGASNYVSAYMANKHTRGEVENIKIKRYVQQMQKQLELDFLTDSLYCQ